MRLDTASAEAYYNRGNAKLQLKDYDGALADVNHAIKLKESDEEGYLVRANIKIAQKNYEGAIDDYNSVLFINLDYVIVFAYRGLAYSMLKSAERMNADFNYALKLEPRNEEIINLLAAAKRNISAN